MLRARWLSDTRSPHCSSARRRVVSTGRFGDSPDEQFLCLLRRSKTLVCGFLAPSKSLRHLVLADLVIDAVADPDDSASWAFSRIPYWPGRLPCPRTIRSCGSGCVHQSGKMAGEVLLHAGRVATEDQRCLRCGFMVRSIPCGPPFRSADRGTVPAAAANAVGTCQQEAHASLP